MSREGNFTYETDSDENPYKTSVGQHSTLYALGVEL